jgi:SAM-dependent methyltransferase
VWSDPFERWSALQAFSTDASNRLDEGVDLAFWERVATSYDDNTLARRVPAVLERVRELVPSGASLLEVGAGTGAFAVPLAAVASRVTALDHSPAMLRVLETKLRLQHAPANVTMVLGRWEDAEVEGHDVVLAANALYRTVQPRVALSKLVSTARRRGIVVWSVGRQDAPQSAVREHVRPGRYRPGPDYVHLVEALFALDVFARVEIIDVDDTQHFACAGSAVDALLSWQPIDDEEHARAVALLPHVLEPDGDGWTWRRRGRIAVIWWDQPT